MNPLEEKTELEEKIEQEQKREKKKFWKGVLCGAAKLRYVWLWESEFFVRQLYQVYIYFPHQRKNR